MIITAQIGSVLTDNPAEPTWTRKEEHMKKHYNDFVNHMTRFYVTHLEQTDWRSDVDAANWICCHYAFIGLTPQKQEIVKAIYSMFSDDEPMAIVVPKYIKESFVWTTLKLFAQDVAMLRGLIPCKPGKHPVVKPAVGQYNVVGFNIVPGSDEYGKKVPV